MFKLLIAAFTSLSLMFGAAETVTSQPGEPFYNVKEWSVQSWNRIQQQERSADSTPAEEPLQDQTRDQFRDQTQDQLCDPVLGTVCEPAQDQIQDQLRLHQEAAAEPLHLNPQGGNGYGDGDGTCDADCTPAAEPGPHGNGH